MAVLSRDKILARKCRTFAVEVPEWSDDPDNPDSVIVRELTVNEQEAVSKSSKGDAVKMAMKAFITGCVDPQFTAEDYDALKEQGGAGVQRVVAKILTVSGMTEAAQNEILGK